MAIWTWLSNVDDSTRDSAGPRQARALLYSRAASIPADAMLIGNMQADIPDRAEVFATEIGSGPLLLGDLRRLSPEDRAWYRDHIEWYKHLRARVNISESFFPLGSWQQPSAVEWDGFARLSHTGSGVVTVFRNESGVPSVTLKLPFIPQGRFKVSSALTHREVGIVSSQELVEGFRVSFADAQTVEILELEAVPESASHGDAATQN